jgi:hypothetical protein
MPRVRRRSGGRALAGAGFGAAGVRPPLQPYPVACPERIRMKACDSRTCAGCSGRSVTDLFADDSDVRAHASFDDGAVGPRLLILSQLQ